RVGFLLYSHRDHRDLHSFPTRRSSDLLRGLLHVQHGADHSRAPGYRGDTGASRLADAGVRTSASHRPRGQTTRPPVHPRTQGGRRRAAQIANCRRPVSAAAFCRRPGKITQPPEASLRQTAWPDGRRRFPARCMIELIQFPWSPFCIVQRRILEFAGSKFKMTNIPNTDRSLVWKLTRGRYYAVPVVRDGKSIVFETDETSQVIAKYLDDRLQLVLFPRALEG